MNNAGILCGECLFLVDMDHRRRPLNRQPSGHRVELFR
jgi:hypothetical protein